MKQIFNERKKRILEFQKAAKKLEYTFEPIEIPNHLFIQCENCFSALYHKEFLENQSVCTHCGYHFRIGAKKRIELTVDEDSFEPLFGNLESLNPLNINEYEEKLRLAKEVSGLNEACLTGTALMNNMKVAIAVLDSTFMMGSMGSVVGEKITLLIEYATKHNLPLIIFSASGGARMQEGMLSLMQMAKTSGALSYFNNLYVSVLTNPTTGGVAASFASLGDINIAEKTAIIGFAGKRVIKQTIQQNLPDNFQTENFQLEKGQVDLIAHRKDIREKLIKILELHEVPKYE